MVFSVKNQSAHKIHSAILNIYVSKQNHQQKYADWSILLPNMDAYNEVVLSELLPPFLKNKHLWIELSLSQGLEKYYPAYNMYYQSYWDTQTGQGYYFPEFWNEKLGRFLDLEMVIEGHFYADDQSDSEEYVSQHCHYEMLTTYGAIFRLPAPGISFVNADALRQAMLESNPRQTNSQFTHFNGHWRLHNGIYRCH